MRPRDPFLEGPEKFSHPESHSKISTLVITELFYSHFLTWTEIPFIQEVSGPYTSPFLDTDELKMAFRVFRQPGPRPKTSANNLNFLAHSIYNVYNFELSTLWHAALPCVWNTDVCFPFCCCLFIVRCTRDFKTAQMSQWCSCQPVFDRVLLL